MPAVGFSLEDARRIAAATRTVERTPQDMTGERNPAGPAATSCWAYLLSPSMTNHWSWLKLVPAADLPSSDDPYSPLEPERPLFSLSEPVHFSLETAREMNNVRTVPAGSVVELRFIGYDRQEKPVYVFQYNAAHPDAGLVPIHDHRDNITGGGFAFATYHPGTGLPQQAWRA